MRGEEGTSLIYCISYQLYIYYSAVRTDHVWSCLAATHRLSITWSTDHGARVSGHLLRYPVTTVRLSGSLKALPVYWCRGWRLGLRRLMDLVLVGASRPFNTLFHFGQPVALRGTSPDFGPLSGTFCWWVISFAHFSHLDQLFHFLKKKKTVLLMSPTRMLSRWVVHKPGGSRNQFSSITLIALTPVVFHRTSGKFVSRRVRETGADEEVSRGLGHQKT